MTRIDQMTSAQRKEAYDRMERVRTTYEWVCEWTDEVGDILDSQGWDTLAEAMADAAVVPASFENAEITPIIALRRDVGCDADGITDRQYAYIGQGDTEFSEGAAIPKRFVKEWEKHNG